MLSAVYAGFARARAGHPGLIAALCALSCAGVFAQEPTVFWVAASGSDLTGNGSAAEPWATIGNAVAKAPETGGTIVVRDGTYGRVSIARKFKAPLTIRAEHAYRARLRADNAAVLSIVASANVIVTGFDIAKTLYPNSPLTAQIARSEGVALIDNIIHDSMNNDVLKVNESSRQVLIAGNLFYNQEGAAGQLIDLNKTVDVAVRENIFMNDPDRTAADLMPTHGFIVVKNSDGFGESRRNVIAGNVFLNFVGSAGSNFVLFGEDGLPKYETQDNVVENNLMLGNSAAGMRSPVGVKGCRDILIRNNTVAGDLPSSAFGMRLNREGLNQRNRNIRFYNNIWSDPTGTMTNFSDGAPADSTGTVLERNLYWNGGQALPGGENLTPLGDARAVVRNPLLTTPRDVVLPRWTGEAFTSGSSTVRQEFERLVRLYGTPPAAGRRPGRIPGGIELPATAGAVFENAPASDILGRPRGLNPDFGAVQQGAPETPYRLLLVKETFAGAGVTTVNHIVLRAPAGRAGATIALASSDPSAVRVPGSVQVQPGALAAPFSIEALAVERPTRVMLTASGPDGIAGAAVTVTPPGVRSVNTGAENVTAGDTVTGNEVLYDGEAGPEGVTVALESSRPDVLEAPPAVLIPAGRPYSEMFAMRTKFTAAATPVVVTATAGTSKASAELTVNPPVFQLMLMNPAGGEALITGNRISLDRPAPAGGAAVQISNPRPDLLELPGTVTVPEGEVAASFSFRTKVIDETITVKPAATWEGRSTSASLTLTPVKLNSLVLPPAAAGGSGVTATLYMGTLTERDITVQITLNDGAPASAPATVVVPGQAWYTRFNIDARAVAANTTVTVTATYRGNSVTGQVVLTPATLASLRATPAGILEGGTATFTAALNGAAPEGGVAVDVSASSPAVQIPASVAIPGGAASVTFQGKAAQVVQRTEAQVSASAGGVVRTATLVISPIEAALLVVPATVTGGSSEGKSSKVVLNAPALEWTKVRLASSNPAVLAVPAEVPGKPGQYNVYFDLTTAAVREATAVTVTARVNSAEIAATVKVTPPAPAAASAGEVGEGPSFKRPAAAR